MTYIKLPTLLTTHAYFTFGYAFLIPELVIVSTLGNEVTQYLNKNLTHLVVSRALKLAHLPPSQWFFDNYTTCLIELVNKTVEVNTTMTYIIYKNESQTSRI